MSIINQKLHRALGLCVCWLTLASREGRGTKERPVAVTYKFSHSLEVADVADWTLLEHCSKSGQRDVASHAHGRKVMY